MRGSRSLVAGGVAAALWVAFPGCSDENASLTEAQGGGGASGQAGAAQDASAGGSSGAVTGGSAGSSSGGSSGTETGGSSGAEAGGAAGTAGSAGAPQTGGSAPDAGIGGEAGTAAGGSPPDGGPDGSQKNDAAPDSPTEAGPVVCATTAQCEAQWANDPCKANVVCDGATSTCKFSVLDKDGDGHPPVVCGGDDCDDSQNAVAPGKPELCDGVDNNCDGANNEGSACPPDQPCPTEGQLYDCSGSCAPVFPKCASAVCSTSPYAYVGLRYETDFPAVLRTPSQPGLNSTCEQLCGSGPLPAAYSLAVQINAKPPYFEPGTQDYIVRVRVKPPYRIHHTQYPTASDVCGSAVSVTGCELVDLFDTVFITTDDPYAPATNVSFELIHYGMGMCP